MIIIQKRRRTLVEACTEGLCKQRWSQDWGEDAHARCDGRWMDLTATCDLTRVPYSLQSCMISMCTKKCEKIKYYNPIIILTTALYSNYILFQTPYKFNVDYVLRISMRVPT